jgi:hypothetical protein
MIKRDTPNKTRDLSYYEYYTQLQLEYMVAELRKKIYPTQKDKAYYQKVMDGKRKIIEDISLRNSLKSIFSSNTERQAKYSLIYTIPYPNFLYRDKADRDARSYKDKMFYYMSGSEVNIKTPTGEDRVGILKYATFKAATAEVQYKDNSIDIVPLSYITRIL